MVFTTLLSRSDIILMRLHIPFFRSSKRMLSARSICNTALSDVQRNFLGIADRRRARFKTRFVKHLHTERSGRVRLLEHSFGTSNVICPHCTYKKCIKC